MSPRAATQLRTVATLVVLALLLLLAVQRGLAAVTEPFPESADPPICVDEAISAGDVVRPGGVTVSVVNAGTQAGRARATLDALVDAGFARGEVTNQRDEGVRSAQVWSTTGGGPAIRLVRSYLRGDVELVERASTVAGVTVVVGDDFEGVRDGRGQVKAGADSTVCGPAALS
ncbi:LytR C-terminal domain-containing protein [Nocardioides litoris]|uniref:LytR C-terminal domain-containing protein n=1 Tax=Nocardioides litoris TaxID=1926648 RepID=UPI001120EFFA|nr:LytR C-terminal domain-containing protein [Nocardioides litoris]